MYWKRNKKRTKNILTSGYGHTCSMTKNPYLFGFIANFTASHKIILLFSYRLCISISMFYSRSRQTWIAHKLPELQARQFSVRYHQMRPKYYIISVRLYDVILLLTFFVNIRRSILKLRVLKGLNGNCNWLVFATANWIRVTWICSMGIGGKTWDGNGTIVLKHVQSILS